ncbi:MAG: tRNA uridine-5-carboxymethylaminomethyl(34) synthesis GTPase MnmE [Candidatus Omnitrophica bacterium]|nr:tRNA uridine-5-carboxymethylaminomethyl(34) synthesis GTPase MnmE [Candidatus Omnitrophota bacterium]
MLKHDNSDTIAAISTCVGEGGIGIVRLSGKDALKIADKVFRSNNNLKPTGFKTFTTHYGWISDGDKIIDEVILTVMRAPRSFTKEDIVEINCHGGIIPLRAILDLVVSSGCRLAEPGEFTKRAFLNGRIDLAQAEAVLDIIRAKTDAALKLGVEQLKGGLSKELNKTREMLLDVLTLLEANIDFPEEGIDKVDLREYIVKLKDVEDEFNKIISGSQRGRVYREGIRAVICGKPNVGKSSLLNALLKCERSIVTSVAGTTRDTIEEIIDIKGIPVRIADTAGILEPRGIVEKKAVERSQKHIGGADLIVVIFDGSRGLDKADLKLIKKLPKKPVIAVINKMDLRQKINIKKLCQIFPRVIEISAKKTKNIEVLEEGIADLVYKGKVSSGEPAMVSNLRHISAIRKAQILIAEARNSLDNTTSLEFVAQDIKDALTLIDDILGKRFSEDLLDKIFSEFCIGK